MANQHFRELWAQCVKKHTKTPMNWQTIADDYARLIVEECIVVVAPSDYHRAHPENYVGGQDTIDLLNYKLMKLNALLK